MIWSIPSEQSFYNSNHLYELIDGFRNCDLNKNNIETEKEKEKEGEGTAYMSKEYRKQMKTH